MVALMVAVALAGTIPQRRPGTPPPEPEPVVEVDPDAVAPPEGPAPLPVAVRNRWRLVEEIGVNARWWDPYHQNPLKGDRPLGADWFAAVRGVSDSRVRAGTVASAARQGVLLGATLWRGDTVFEPPEVALDVAGEAHFDAVTGGGAVGLGLRSAHLTVRPWVTGPRFDFDHLRVGLQPWVSDFRGLVLRDDQPGVRWTGTRFGNRLQYSLGWLRRLPHDATGLVELDRLGEPDDVFVASAYVRDVPAPGLKIGVSGLYHRRRVSGSERDVVYAGAGVDGAVRIMGWQGGVTAWYWRAAGRAVEPTPGIEARVGADLLFAEVFVHSETFRVRGHLLGSGGDDDEDPVLTGFDDLAGAPWVGDGDLGAGLLGAALGELPRAGFLPVLRDEPDLPSYRGRALSVYGLGADLEALPTLTLTGTFTQAADDQLEPGPLRPFREIGWALDVGARWRPRFDQVVVLRAGVAVMFPDRTMRDRLDLPAVPAALDVRAVVSY